MSKAQVGTIRIVTVNKGVWKDRWEFQLIGSDGSVLARSETYDSTDKSQTRNDRLYDLSSTRNQFNAFVASLLGDGWQVLSQAPFDSYSASFGGPGRWHALTMTRTAS